MVSISVEVVYVHFSHFKAGFSRRWARGGGQILTHAKPSSDVCWDAEVMSHVDCWTAD